MKTVPAISMTVLLMICLAASATIARGGPLSRISDDSRFDLRQFLSQIVAEAPHPLTGKPAPDTSAKLLDGSKVTLADYEGNTIVVLDFWASWCPPCRASLPVFQKVAADYKDKNVVFIAVNQGEDVDTIKRYLERTGLEFTVMLDTDGAIGNNFKVEGIPQTVIIGKEGIVQAVHEGFSRDSETQLRSELDTLLSGKSLVTPRA